MSKKEIPCKTCGDGVLKKKKKYRMNGAVVAIGYLILLPCVIGMLIGIGGLFVTSGASGDSFDSVYTVAKEELVASNVPSATIDKIINGEIIDETEMGMLSEKQAAAVASAQLSISAGSVGAGVATAAAGGISIGVFIFSFMGGLLGWLLTMKKKVLQCGSCSAVVAAS